MIKTIKQGDKNKYEYGGTIYDSKEEIWFLWWIMELQEKRIIDRYEYQPDSIVLSEPVPHYYDEILKTKTKKMKQKFLAGHIYTPDYRIIWHNTPGCVLMFADRIPGVSKYRAKLKCQAGPYPGDVSYIEVKAQFDRNNMTRSFMTDQKWIWQRCNIFINLVKIGNKPGNFFSQTFTPKKYLLTDAGIKKRKLHYEPKMLGDILCQH